MTKRAALMTTRINIDVKFKTPEAAALGFGLLYHAAGVVQSGCRQQLIAGMADEPTAENFIAHALRDDRVREAAIGLAGRIMEDSLRALASGLELGEEAAPIALDREPAQIVHDGLAEILARDWVPSLDLVRSWSMDMLESASAWILAVHEERRHGRPDPTIPRTLAEALSLDAGDVARNELPVRSRLATPDASSSQVSNAALPTAETSTPGADPGATPPPTVGSEDALFESLSTSGAEGWGIEEIEADFEREPLGYFSTEGEERVRLVVFVDQVAERFDEDSDSIHELSMQDTKITHDHGTSNPPSNPGKPGDIGPTPPASPAVPQPLRDDERPNKDVSIRKGPDQVEADKARGH